MGGSGTGKTTFVNLASGSKFLVGEGLESCTDSVQTRNFVFEGKDVTLIDVPGFDDTTKSDIDVLQIITDFLISEYQANRLLTGVLYFHRISDVRMGGTSKRNFTMFQKLCGIDAVKNVAIVTTRWDKEKESIAVARYNELSTNPQFFQPILEKGGKIFRHDRGVQSAQNILRHIISQTPIPLLIQHEIVNDHKHLVETAAGAELHREIMEQVEEHRKELAEIIEEMEQSGDSDLEDLERECQELRERMAHWYTESDKLSNMSTSKPQSLRAAESSSPSDAKKSTLDCPPRPQESIPEGNDAVTVEPRNTTVPSPLAAASHPQPPASSVHHVMGHVQREAWEKEVLRKRVQEFTQGVQATFANCRAGSAALVKHVSEGVRNVAALL
ncbi:hypothetical protein GYMLUDRAFT_50604 [Collybiopsis luxurians FD-317 M1]|uniref:G domain-containing protein n=1 Tax=Collybiopsis luxurians FD-317 M1 TaxID=944289 RepID=A0A0D0BP67_9AGAR|nr:hypothetical protein GYMLUDRAFT_50604 [Collybiopsis luxurians FD-317 M1]